MAIEMNTTSHGRLFSNNEMVAPTGSTRPHEGQFRLDVLPRHEHRVEVEMLEEVERRPRKEGALEVLVADIPVG